MRLNIGMVTAEELFGALAGKILGDIHPFAAAVVPLSRVPFGVLVGHHSAGGLEHRFGDEIFRGDQFEFGGLRGWSL